MAAEEITRGQIRMTLTSLLARHPAAFTKEFVLSRLEPVVKALKKDLGVKTSKNTHEKGER